MPSENIYKLTIEYNQTVANETSESLKGCVLLYNIKKKMLENYNNNEQSAGYKKEINQWRKDNNVKKSIFSKDAAVGEWLVTVYHDKPSNDKLSKSAIYKQYCAPPKQQKAKKPEEPTVDWKAKYDALQAGYRLLLPKLEDQAKEIKRLKLIIREYDTPAFVAAE